MATNTGRSTVSIIDTTTNAVLGSPINVSSSPGTALGGIAITPDGTRAYVTNAGKGQFTPGTVSVIDTTTNTVFGSPIPVGVAPLGVAITTDGTRAYVINDNDNTVSVIDTTTNTVLGSPIAVGAAPSGIAITQIIVDTIPPVTTAVPSPGPNPNGWNNTNINLTLNSTDNEPGGTGVKEIHFTLAGAQTGSSIVAGGTASVVISAEGTTTLTYFAIDNAGNQETPKMLIVNIDKTPPVISGMPASGCSLWPPNHKFVHVGDVKATDALSGVEPGSLKVSGTSNERQDPNDPDILIADDGAGGFTIQLRAERLGHGNGRVYTLNATATDLAGNTANTTATCMVPHDQRK
jgi:YVTN family beta-propeller protein